MVLVYADEKKLMLELLSKGRELAQSLNEKLIAVSIGKDEYSKEYIEHGADQVVVVDSSLSHFKVEEYTELLKNTITETKSETILIGSTKNGKELAARLSAVFDTGCEIDCTKVYVKDKKLMVERVVYSGNAIAVTQFQSTPSIVTIPPKIHDPLPKDVSRKGEVIKKKFTIPAFPSKIITVKEMKSESVNVEDAEIIVSCGRGFKKKDDIKLVSDLADALHGKTVGCSRPIAADLKWLSEDHWVGLSGHKVKPKLYVACGISGQIQHIAGMRDSGVVVAINKDPEALIFKSADYGIVADLYEVLPKLTSALKEKQ